MWFLNNITHKYSKNEKYFSLEFSSILIKILLYILHVTVQSYRKSLVKVFYLYAHIVNNYYYIYYTLYLAKVWRGWCIVYIYNKLLDNYVVILYLRFYRNCFSINLFARMLLSKSWNINSKKSLNSLEVFFWRN